MRLFYKLLFAVLPVIVTPFLILGVYTYFSLNQEFIKEATNQSNEQIEQVHFKFIERINTAEANLNLIANSSLVDRFISEQNTSNSTEQYKAEVIELFKSYLKVYPYYESIQLITDNDNKVVKQARSEDNKNITIDWLKKTGLQKNSTNQITTVLSQKEKPSDKFIVAQSLPNIRNGYVLIVSKLDVIKKTDSNVNRNHPLYLLFDEYRNVLSSNHEELIPWRTSPEEIESMLNASKEIKLASMNINKQAFLGVAKQIELDLTLAVLIPRNNINTINKNVSITVLSIVSISIVLICFWLYFCLRKLIVKPIKEINTAAIAFAGGDLQTPLITKPRFDSIGMLASSLEKMRRNLSKKYNETQRMVNQDSLTGLPNRRSIMERLEAEIVHCKRIEGKMFALMFIDLDNFKGINDSMGHKAGDRLVIKVAQRLVETVRAYDSVAINTVPESNSTDDSSNFVARLGGDEFLMILNDIEDTANVARIAERIYGLFKEPLYIDELQFHVGMSIGIVVYPENGETPEQLIKYADLAMYSAKSAGKNQYRYYDNSMNTSARQSLEIESELRKALSENSLELHFQPQFDLITKELTGCEVLVRWFHKERSWISPAEFVPIAESCGLIHELGDWILKAACHQFRLWQENNFTLPNMSINLSSHQVASNGTADKIIELMQNQNLKPSTLEFELTETAIFNNKEVVMNNLEKIRSVGAKIALDDFGTGYSSLAWVEHCSVDVIKIDRSFVQDIGNDKKHRAIIASVVELCRQLNITIVAEGIESEKEAEILSDMGCHIAQGYFYSRPLSVTDFENFVTNYNSEELLISNA